LVLTYREGIMIGDSPGMRKRAAYCTPPGRGFTMSAIELNEKEVATLVRALESYLPDLATERVGTDNREWHAKLMEQEAILGDILKRLQAVKL
jgi:hypothetical protein